VPFGNYALLMASVLLSTGVRGYVAVAVSQVPFPVGGGLPRVGILLLPAHSPAGSSTLE